MNKTLHKLENIEFLRVLFIIFILVHHFGAFAVNILSYNTPIQPSFALSQLKDMQDNALHCVDFFLIIAGFFLVYTFNKSISFCNFAKKKILRLWPLIPVVTLSYFIFSIFHLVEFTPYYDILSLFFLNNMGLTLNLGNNPQLWYVSSLFWGYLFYFYIIKNYEKKNVDLFVALLTFFCYAFLFHADNQHFGHHVQSFNYVFNAGFMRALGGMGIGYFIGNWFVTRENNCRKDVSIVSKLIYTAAEGYLLVFLTNNLIFHHSSNVTPVILVFFFSLLFILFLLQRGYISQSLNKPKFSTIGKYTYTIFIIHFAILVPFVLLINSQLPLNILALNKLYLVQSTYIFFCITLGVLTYHLIEAPISAKLKKVLFNKNEETESST